MEIRHLKLIKAVVEEGGITSAMNTLHLTQSAISHQLKEAEYQLGTKIFDRVNKKLILTQAGEKLYNLALEIIEKIELTEAEIKDILSGENGTIRIYAGCFTGYHWLPSLMRKFHSIYPNVALKIISDDSIYPSQKLLNGEVDLVISIDPINTESIDYTEILKDEIIALVSKKHDWAKKKFVSAEDFSEQNLIIYSLPMESVLVHSTILAAANIAPQKITVMPLTEATIELVQANMGVKTIAKWASKPYLKNSDIKAVKIGSKGLKISHYIATLKNKTYPAYYHKFIEILKTENSK